MTNDKVELDLLNDVVLRVRRTMLRLLSIERIQSIGKLKQLQLSDILAAEVVSGRDQQLLKYELRSARSMIVMRQLLKLTMFYIE